MRRSAVWIILAGGLLLVFASGNGGTGKKSSESTPAQNEAAQFETAQTSAADSAQAPARPEGWFGRGLALMIPPFVDEFKGLDLSALSPAQRERFLHRANTELCTCGQSGCPRHTLAFCQKVDSKCPRALMMLRTILHEVALETAQKAPLAGGARGSEALSQSPSKKPPSR